MSYFEVIDELPSFAKDFIYHLMNQNKSENTCKAYTYELRFFFRYLCDNKDGFPSQPQKITLDIFQTLQIGDIEQFIGYSRTKLKNRERARAKKQAVIRSLYNYLYKKDKIKENIAQKLDSIKITRNIPKALERDQIDAFIESITEGKGLTKKQLEYHAYTAKRDYAIFVTLHNTALRLFELCDLSLSNMSYEHKEFYIIGKGGDEYRIPLNEEVLSAISDYVDNERPRYAPKEEIALFVSIQGKRMSHRAMQSLMKKYMTVLTHLGYNMEGFGIHKMRSTSATWLYRETHNIKIVKDFLRHKHLSTTEIYTKVDQEELHHSAKLLKFRRK